MALKFEVGESWVRRVNQDRRERGKDGPATKRNRTPTWVELRYLPPCSPDLNPIEQVFAKFKRLIRSAAERTVAGLGNRCGQLLPHFEERECRNYFRHCGYRYV